MTAAVRFAVLLCCLLAAAAPAVRALDREASLEHGGRSRDYRLMTPPGAPADPRGWPLVFLLHGGGGNHARIGRVTDIDERAPAVGFVTVLPDAVEGHWNDGRGAASFPSHQERVDDVGFLVALAERVARELPVDRGRIYAVGASNGGMMVQRLGCEAADRFAALASVIGSMPAPLAPACNPAAPVPMLIMNGTEDRLMPWDGGPVAPMFGERGAVISTAATRDFWLRANGCRGAPEVRVLPDLDPDDGVSELLERAGGCAGAAEVLLFTAQGGGHRWPGGESRGILGRRLLGNTPMDIDATAEILAFFERHRR